MKIKLDLHIHSAASYDGCMSVDEIIRTARARGLNGVAVTDHDVTLTDAPLCDDFLIIPGCEFSTEFGHLLGLFLREPIGNMSFVRTVNAIHAQGGLAVIAHPFEHTRDGSRIMPFAQLLDGVEVWNGRAERKIRDANALALAFAEEQGLRYFAGSDAHVPEEIGNGVVELDVQALTLPAVKTALLNAEVAASGKRGASLCVARSQYTKLQKRHARPAAYAKWLLFAGKCAYEDTFRKGK